MSVVAGLSCPKAREWGRSSSFASPSALVGGAGPRYSSSSPVAISLLRDLPNSVFVSGICVCESFS